MKFLKLKKSIIQFAKKKGYYLHRLSTLPLGINLFNDIKYRMPSVRIHTIFDVGANVGQSIKIFRENSSDSIIYAFEPVKNIFDKLEKNIECFDNIFLNNIALGDKSGEVMISLFDDSKSDLNSLNPESMNQKLTATKEKIIITTLDNYCEKNKIKEIDLLKIDSEGYEIKILQGGTNMLINKNIKLILCEVGFTKLNKRNTLLSELTGFLDSYGYFFYSIYDIKGFGDSGLHYANVLFAKREILNF